MAAAALALCLAAGCANPDRAAPTLFPSVTPNPSATPTATPLPPTFTRSHTATISQTPTVTRKWPLTVVFYGDSLLKVGEVGRQGKSGYSFVDDLREKLDPGYNLITANYGGRMAKWAFENLEPNVLVFQPDVVALWWGFNDLLGCPGFFDRTTNAIIPEKMDYLAERHIQYLQKQIDVLVERNIPVIVITVIPVHGGLPWSHFDENGRVVWEAGYWCDYNLGLKQLAGAQRTLVDGFTAAGKSVFLMDAWNVYTVHWYTDWMYSDVMHPGPTGADLLAEEWIRVFAQTGEIVRRKGE
ncbi:MAG: SGNH/GDSL hydrolase family protein [Anaerolineales bacterium]